VVGCFIEGCTGWVVWGAEFLATAINKFIHTVVVIKGGMPPLITTTVGIIISTRVEERFFGDTPNPGRGLAALCTPAPHDPSSSGFAIISPLHLCILRPIMFLGIPFAEPGAETSHATTGYRTYFKFT